jgi:hypothetical protein
MIIFSHAYFFGFSYIKKCYDPGEETSVMSKKLVLISGTHLCLMHGSSYGTWTLEGIFPLQVKGVKLQRIYKRHCLDSDENYWGNRDYNEKVGFDIRINNARRIMGCNYNLTQKCIFS